MEKVDLPQWASDGTSDIRSDRFADLSKTLDVTISALSTADRLAAGVYGPAVMDELLRLYGRARDLVRTLLTMSRAHLDVNPTDGDIVSVRSRLFARRAELERGAKNVLAALVALPKPGDDPETDRHYETYSELLDWKKVVTSLDPVWEKKNENAAWLYDAMTPLHAMHTHLTSTMALEVEASGRHVRRQSFGMSLIVLRNSDDWVLRRSTFEAMNAWFASHANAFADLLNAICGVRVGLWKTTGASFPDIHLRHERTSPETYRALWQAVDEAIPLLRRSVMVRASLATGTKPEDPAPKVPIFYLHASRPGLYAKRGASYADHLYDLMESASDVDPSFGNFLRLAHERHWVDGRNFSAKTGNAWCDDLPALGAVRILTRFYPDLTTEVRLAHLFGVAHHLHSLHGASPAARLFPLTVTEIAGKFYEALLLRYLRNEAERRGDSTLHDAVEWTELTRITNFLLTIPARHKLLCDIYRERLFGALSVRKLNDLSDASWRHYFGDTTVGADRYVWAYKPHFYRQGTVAYDWQYVLGYLLSEKLVERFAEDPNRGGGVGRMWLESGLLSTDELIRRWLDADPESPAFWRSCLTTVLRPLRRWS